MIVFNECRIDSEGKCLIIEASVENLDIYKNVYIESVTIDTEKTFSDTGPRNEPIIEYKPKELTKVGTMDGIVTTQECECGNVFINEPDLPKSIRLIVSAKDLNIDTFNDGVYFVWVKAGGTPLPTALCCGMDNEYIMRVAVNLRPIYNTAMYYIKELDNTCTIPKGFIDMILRLKAFDLSLKTGNYQVALKYWDMIKDRKVISATNKCRCNGIT